MYYSGRVINVYRNYEASSSFNQALASDSLLIDEYFRNYMDSLENLGSLE